jgi:hypothetical protein
MTRSARQQGELTYDGTCTVTGAERFIDRSGGVHLVRLSGQAAITEGQPVNAVMTTLGVVESVRTPDAEYHSSHPMFNQIDAA